MPAQSFCPTSSCLFALSLCWIGMAFATSSFFPLHHPLFLYILFSTFVCVSSLTSSYFCLFRSIICILSSLYPAGWPKSCAVLELCSGRDKLCGSLQPHILFCPSALTVSMRKRLREGGGRGLKKDNKRDGEEEDKCKEHCEIDGIKHFDG